MSVQSRIGQQQHHNIRTLCQKMTKLNLYGKHSSGGQGDALLLICGECKLGLQIFLLLRRQRSNGFCGDCFCGFCGSYRWLASLADTWPARCAPKCQSLVDKQVDKKSLQGNLSQQCFLGQDKVSISKGNQLAYMAKDLWFGVLQRNVLTPDTSSFVPGIGNSPMTHPYPGLISSLCSNESRK